MGASSFNRKLLVLSICILLPTGLLAQSGLVNHWETVVYDSSIWRYYSGTTDRGPNWIQFNFDDSSWPQGRGSIGYGDGDDRTIDTALSVLLRRKFTIIDKNVIAAIQLNVDYDDGFIAYLNGVEIARANMGTGTPSFNQLAASNHEALLYQGLVPDGWAVDTQLLITGENILTVEVHNVLPTSSDLTSAVFFSVGMTTGAVSYGPVPHWFVPPLSIGFESSNLPIVVINTHDQLIEDGTKIVADMGIIYDAAGNRNSLNDPSNNYNGKISIELHGESSQSFPKKSYRIETEDDSGNNLNVSLLGMPAENDWVLYAPYTDKSMLRNMLAYNLGRNLGKFYAPRAKFVELTLNADYQGVYMLVEKIKQDKNRVNISKLKTTDVSGDALTGGYLLRVDKIDPGDYPAWTPVPVPHLPNEGDVTFQYYDPKGEDLVSVQQDYIKNFILQVESTLSSTNFANRTTGYTKFINLSSFVDFMLVSEISKNVDAYIFSTYMYKDKDSKGGKLTMGPLWDFDLGFGNVNYLENSQVAPGWTYNDGYRMFWFRRLMSDANFADSLTCRWNSLRKNLLSDTHILNTIDSAAQVLAESQVRNYERWPILGTYVWPNQYIGATYQDEVNFLKTWITARLDWIDSNLPGNCTVVTGVEPAPNNSASAVIYPNPVEGSFSIKFNDPPPAGTQITIYNPVGQRIFSDDIEVTDDLTWHATEVNLNSPGLYLIDVRSSGKIIFRSKIIKL